MKLNREYPLKDLKDEVSRIISENAIIFELNSEGNNAVLNHDVLFRLNERQIRRKDKTIIPFEKYTKLLRIEYRRKLSSILKSVDTDRNTENQEGLDTERLMRILYNLEIEYNDLAGNKNIFKRYPCREGGPKIAIKIEQIKQIRSEINSRTSETDRLF